MQEYRKRMSREMKNSMLAFRIATLLMMLFARCNDEQHGIEALAFRGSRAETMAVKGFANTV